MLQEERRAILKIILRDTTLREGIQMPNSHISLEQKKGFIRLLEEAGVPEIEIGLPDGVSACLEVADLIREMQLAIRPTALIPFYTKRWKSQIDQAVDHHLHRIDILGPTSDFMLNDPQFYGYTTQQILERLAPALEYARSKPIEVSVGLIDATRTPLDRLESVLSRLKDLGASRVVIYDSVGIMTPTAMKEFVRNISAVAGIPVLVHCHNDYGMATANSLAAVEGGAEAIDVAVNGVGGRAGNAALEEVALALENLYARSTGIDATRLRELSAMAEELTGVENSATKPIVGEYCFAHLPVMHIRCIAGGNPSAYEPYPPEQIGTVRKFHFALPVDYTLALEPFVRKSGYELSADEKDHLLAMLKSMDGYTESEIIELIHRIKN
jgi:isopropylmalate/homocitrate/citramalate synthase